MAGDIALGIILIGGGLFIVGSLLVWFLSSIDFSH